VYFKRVASLVIISVLLLSILSPIAYASVIYGPESYYRTTGSRTRTSLRKIPIPSSLIVTMMTLRMALSSR
jgi:hypothetical protein